MTVVSLTQASSRLGIDVKTLRRWLVQADLPLQPDPQDARTKGVRLEHLHLLAHQHQRHLVPLSAERSVSQTATPTPLPAPLPAAFLAMPELLSDLQAQIVTLQQQVATLTHLLQQPPAPPVIPPTPAEKTRKPSPRATRATPPTPKAPSKPVHVIPRVEYRADGCYVVICPKKGLLPFEPDTQEWFDWVREQDSCAVCGQSGPLHCPS